MNNVEKSKSGENMKIKTLTVTILTTILISGCAINQDSHKSTQNNQKTTQEEINKNANTDRIANKEEQTENKNTKVEEKSNDGENSIQLEKKYFNVVAVKDGKEVIQNLDNLLILVNKESAYLPDNYVPADLVRPKVRFSFGDQDIEKSYMKKDAAKALETMFKQAEFEGIYLFAVSGYRSYKRQTAVFQAEVNAKGKDKAVEAVALPGQSEHQTGLAMDISAGSVNYTLTQAFEDTDEGKWLRDNAHKFGFILRYPKGKENITKYKYEPWHFRYVGKESAKTIYENNWTLEEFFQKAKAI